MKAIKMFLTVVLVVLIGVSPVLAAETGYKAKQFNGLVYKKIDGKELKLNIHLPEKEGKIAKDLDLYQQRLLEQRHTGWRWILEQVSWHRTRLCRR